MEGKEIIGGFHVKSSPPFWWTKTKDLSLASFVRPPEVIHFSIVVGVYRGWLITSHSGGVFILWLALCTSYLNVVSWISVPFIALFPETRYCFSTQVYKPVPATYYRR